MLHSYDVTIHIGFAARDFHAYLPMSKRLQSPFKSLDSFMLSGDSIAGAVLEEFQKLASKFKPEQRTPKLREWTVLSGIVVSWTRDSTINDGIKLKCVALG
jgi:hypothetical protein